MSRLAVAAGRGGGVAHRRASPEPADGGVDGDRACLIPIARFEVTSGRWRTIGGDPAAARTASPVFRARSMRADLDSPVLQLRFRIDRFLEGTEEHDWDGVHVGLRYASPDDLYYLSLARRDGTVAVKRKSRGRYETLAVADAEVSVGAWHRATVSVADTPDGTQLRLTVDGRAGAGGARRHPLGPASGRPRAAAQRQRQRRLRRRARQGRGLTASSAAVAVHPARRAGEPPRPPRTRPCRSTSTDPGSRAAAGQSGTKRVASSARSGSVAGRRP